MRITALLFSFLALGKNVRSAFTSSCIKSFTTFSASRNTMQLQVSSSDRYARRRGKRLHVNDQWYLVAIEARDCARSPDSTPEEAEEYLQKMLGMEAGCLTGSIPPTSDVCSDPIWFAEIIDDLRKKLGYDGPSEYDPSKSHESEDHVQPNLDIDLHP